MNRRLKIAQISDIHWRGSTRHEEYTLAFEKLFEMLKEQKPDIIVCTGDIFHTKTQGITPEVVEKMVWMFQELIKIAPVRSILGNHDLNLANASRQDAITPIIKAINAAPSLLLFKDSGNFNDIYFPEINWAVFSCSDTAGWEKCSSMEDKINIALFHGAIVGCESDTGYKMTSGEEHVSFFNDYDFALLGDIHKQQFLAERDDFTGTSKPWIGYPGSLIQQNFGESLSKGFLIWEIESKNKWDVSFVELPNLQPFYTFDWPGNVNDALISLKEKIGSDFKKGARYRFLSKQLISDIEKRQIEDFLKEKGAEETNFVFDVVHNLTNIETSVGKIQKTSLRNNPDILIDLYNEYLVNNQTIYNLTEQQQTEASNKITEYLAKLNSDEPDVAARDTKWSIKSIEFDNVFKYGEGNKIDFSKLNGVVGLFAPNRAGKSSIVGTIMYALFNATDRGPVKTAHVINRNSTACKARVHLDINGNDYVVERTSQRDEPKRKRKKEVDDEKTSTSLALNKVLKDGTLLPITSISRDESDRELRRLIGTSEDFLLTSFASQEDMNRFIREGATERKAILSRFLDLDIFKKLADYSKEDCSELNAKTKKYSEVQWEQLIEDVKKEIQSLEASKMVLESRLLEKRQDVDELKNKIMSKEKQFDIASITEFENQIALKTKQIENIQKFELEIISSIKEKQSEILAIDKTISLLNLEELERKNDKLMDLKETVFKLESTYKIETTTLEHQEKSVKKLEVVPCGDMFPSCHFIKDSHENKQKIDTQRTLVSQLKTQYAEAKSLLEEYLSEKISDKIKEHKIMSDKKQKLEASLFELRTKQKNINISQLISEKNILLNKVQSLKNVFGEEEAVSLLENKQLLRELSEEIRTMEESRSDIYVQIGSQKQKLEQLTREKEECSEILTRLQVLESVYKAFSKNGIPAMILKSQLPAINEELKKILTTLVDFEITLETDTSSNAMDIFIKDKTGRRVIETASGMEKTFASLALRVALTNLSNLPKCDLFVLDESFGPLDDMNIHSCLQLISFLKNYFRTILVITHIAPMKEIADKIIDIKTDEEYAYVVV